MTTKKYLEAVLKAQDLDDSSDELKKLQEHRKAVENLLREKHAEAKLTIRYGGSKAKGTLIRELYDLDIVAYVPHGNKKMGETLKDIYEAAEKTLQGSYYVERKTSALRLKSKDVEDYMTDFHIDVVPGRFVDDSKEDCSLYQNGGEKDWLKTNLDVHIAHVKNSGVVPEIRLLKLWKVRRGLSVKQFVWELLIIKILKDSKATEIADRVKEVWTTLRDTAEAMTVKDPANSNNDLTPVLEAAWSELSVAATSTLTLLEASGWEGVFGKVDEETEEKRAAVAAAVASVQSPTRPWCTR